MKLFALAAVLPVLLFAQTKTTGDGVYTAAQAARGESVYSSKCASCHGPDLTGDGQASPLAGKDFTSAWNDQPLSDFFERIHATMPADAPGSLQPAEVADVVAFILNRNGMPAGEAELTAEPSAIKGVKFVTPKP